MYSHLVCEPQTCAMASAVSPHSHTLAHMPCAIPPGGQAEQSEVDKPGGKEIM